MRSITNSLRHKLTVASLAPTRVRWRIVVILAIVAGVTYIDRLNLGIVAKFILEEYHFTTQSMGWILGAFSLGYAIFHVPGGWLADRYGPGRVLAGAILWFSVFTALTAIAPSLPVINWLGAAWAFAIVRFTMGLGEAAALPVGNKLMAYWLGEKELAFGTSIFLAGVGAGGILAPFFISWLIKHWGWRASFFVSGFVGMGLAAVCYTFVTSRPEEHPKVNSAELDLIQSGRKSPQGNDLQPAGDCSPVEKNFGRAFHVGADGQPLLPGLSGVHILHLVFCLRHESPGHHYYQSKLLGFCSICGQRHYGSAVGLAFRSCGGKTRQAHGTAKLCVAGHRVFSSVAMVRESNRE